LDFSDTYLISEDDYNSICKRSWVEAGDILFAMIGTIGNPVVLKPGEDNIATKNVGIFRFDGDIKKSMWFLLFLKSTLGKRQIDNETSGSTQKYFALNKLRDLKVPVPENETEIEKAVSVYNGLSEQLAFLKNTHRKICGISRLVKTELLLGGGAQ
jgi:type I restriction enzyme S subunit